MTQILHPTAPDLKGLRVLIIEDQFLIAEEMSRAVRSLGGQVVGPLGTLEAAGEAIDKGAFDVAVLDVNLHGEMAFPLAEKLESRGAHFVFATGYEDWTIPEGFRQRPCLRKPVTARRLADAIAAVRSIGEAQP
jgi:two-component SAPR family response regulator